MSLDRREFLALAAAFGAGKVLGSGCAVIPKAVSQARPRIVQERDGKALIINGDIELFKHIENVFRAYKFLRGIGYRQDSIYILSTPYEVFPDFLTTRLQKVAKQQGIDLPVILGPGTKRNVETIIGDIFSDNPREIFVYATGHGGHGNKSSYAVMHKRAGFFQPDILPDIHLKRLLAKGKARFKKGIIVFDGCDGEGFSRNIGDKNITAIAANKFGEDYPCEMYTEQLFNAHLATPFSPTMWEALAQVKINLRTQGLPVSQIVTGKYNPVLWATGTNNRGYTVPVKIPRGRIKPITGILHYKNVVKVDQSNISRTLADQDAVFYFHDSSCTDCELMDKFASPLIERMPGKLYIISPASPRIGDVEKKLGVKVSHVPRLIRTEQGKITNDVNGLPIGFKTYGSLPDNRIEVYDKSQLEAALK